MLVSGGPIPQPAEEKIVLAQTKISEIERHRRSKYPFLTKPSETGVVKCQCGWSGTDSEMVRCYGTEFAADC